MTWENFENYLRSYSSFHTFQAQNPSDAERKEGDIVTRFIRSVKEGMKTWNKDGKSEVSTEQDVDEEIEIEWPLALVLAKKI